jgi:hypothetical protein
MPGQNNVLIIDEAQNLDTDVLEQLRLLTNLETSERKLLQIVLIGQPELRDVLARPELEQLAQRVIARFHLDALSEAETAQYIAHRLGVAGHTGALPFDARALQAHSPALARGVPRRINLLCDRALLGAYADRPGHGRPGAWWTRPPAKCLAPTYRGTRRASWPWPGCSGRAAAGRGRRAGRGAEPQPPKRRMQPVAPTRWPARC